MNKQRIVALAAAVSIMASMPMLVRGDTPTYDPAGDPLVSLSYITEVVTPAYDAKIKALDDSIRALSATVSSLSTELSSLQSENAALRSELSAIANREAAGTLESYEILTLNKGDRLYANGPLEIILRSGTAIVMSMTVNGVNDLSDGSEITGSGEVPLYHLLLVPRGNDGRGIQITSKEAYVMVRGDYQIVN